MDEELEDHGSQAVLETWTGPTGVELGLTVTV